MFTAYTFKRDGIGAARKIVELEKMDNLAELTDAYFCPWETDHDMARPDMIWIEDEAGHVVSIITDAINNVGQPVLLHNLEPVPCRQCGQVGHHTEAMEYCCSGNCLNEHIDAAYDADSELRMVGR